MQREHFRSKLGFVLAAAGSAVGLGNIWGFPTQAANNGGGAFLLVYLAVVLLLGYPALMAELLIGRFGQGNPVNALRRIAPGRASRRFGHVAGCGCVVIAVGILSFYSIVAGWMLAFGLAAAADVLGATAIAAWLTDFSISRNLLMAWGFIGLTAWIIHSGVQKGIERWSRRLMPTLVVLLVALTAYVLTRDGAMAGLRLFLVPDFPSLRNPQLIVAALGQAFFSLSLGVGAMIVYGSYLGEAERLPRLGGQIALLDTGIAFLAGLLVLPAMFVAQARGVEIFTAEGALVSEQTLIFNALPGLFDQLGGTGTMISLGFFLLLTIAALTSTIATLEIPVAYLLENHEQPRRRATVVVSLAIAVMAGVLAIAFETLFGLVVAAITRFALPLMGLVFFVFCGWLWRRASLLETIVANDRGLERTLFIRTWPTYVKYVCPVLMILVFLHTAF